LVFCTIICCSFITSNWFVRPFHARKSSQSSARLEREKSITNNNLIKLYKSYRSSFSFFFIKFHLSKRFSFSLVIKLSFIHFLDLIKNVFLLLLLQQISQFKKKTSFLRVFHVKFFLLCFPSMKKSLFELVVHEGVLLSVFNPKEFFKIRRKLLFKGKAFQSVWNGSENGTNLWNSSKDVSFSLLFQTIC